MKNENDKLNQLIGEEMSGFSFVRDYMEFHFDGTILRAFGHSAVGEDGTMRSSESKNFCSVAKEMIGLSIQSVLLTDESIVVNMDLEKKIVISILIDAESSPEAAHVKLRNEPGIIVF